MRQGLSALLEQILLFADFFDAHTLDFEVFFTVPVVGEDGPAFPLGFHGQFGEFFVHGANLLRLYFPLEMQIPYPFAS